MLPESETQPDRSFETDRDSFDNSVRRFLAGTAEVHWAEARTPPYDELDEPDYVETIALADFFQKAAGPLAILLRQTGLQDYLTRPIDKVEFTGDAYEPLLSTYEGRIYNLAARNGVGHVPFRYAPDRRQNVFGDTVKSDSEPDDIGNYFGTRRADSSVTALMTGRLEEEAAKHTPALPVHVTNRGGSVIHECLASAVEHARSAGDGLRCYVTQNRHDLNTALGRHFGTLLTLVEGGPQPRLHRAVFFDSTRMHSGEVHWKQDFANAIDAVFPAAPGENRRSDMLEDGGIGIQRRHDGMPERHKDIDCSLYTFAMARALIQVACEQPDLVLCGGAHEIRSEMTARMPEYFDGPDRMKSPEDVRQIGIAARWSMGRDYLKAMVPTFDPLAEPVPAQLRQILLAELLTPSSPPVPGAVPS